MARNSVQRIAEFGIWFDGDWGFGQNRQERKCAFELNIVVDVVGQYVLNGRGEEERERERGGRLLSCPMISCHINIFDLLIIGEYHAAEVGTSLQYEF